MEIAVQDDGQFLNADAGRRIAAFEHARALGASSLRANVPWASVAPDPQATVAPARPRTTSSRFDRVVDEAAAYGIRVQLTLAGPAPAWATADHTVSQPRARTPPPTAPSPAPSPPTSPAACARCRSGTSPTGTACSRPREDLPQEQVREDVRPPLPRAVPGRLRRHQGRRRPRCRCGSARPTRTSTAASSRRRRSRGSASWSARTRSSRAARASSRPTATPITRTRSTRAEPARPGRDNVTIANLGALTKQLHKLRGKLRIAAPPIYLTEFAYYSSGPNAKPEKKRAGVDQEGVQDRAQGQERAPAPLLPADRPADGRSRGARA